MSQEEILTLLTPEWQSTAQIVEAAGRRTPPVPLSTVKFNLSDLALKGRAEREYRGHSAYWRLAP